jgi:hypothetical protein
MGQPNTMYKGLQQHAWPTTPTMLPTPLQSGLCVALALMEWETSFPPPLLTVPVWINFKGNASKDLLLP